MGVQFKNYALLAVVLVFTIYYVLLGTGLFSRVWANQIAYRYWIGIIAVSTATFVLYGIDKVQAVKYQQKAKNRVPELLLHLLTLLGGFVGGWLGMFVFWHKVRKPVFWAVLIIATGLQMALWVTLPMG
jgi:uncharacterized membrane protein YsdA (DUF1294 family)